MRLFKMSNYKKGFLLSLTLHSLLLLAILYEKSNPLKPTPQQNNKISISLSSFTPPKEVQKPQVAPAPPETKKEKIVKNEKPKEKKADIAPKKPKLAKKQVEVKKTPQEPQEIQEEQIQELAQSEPTQEPLIETQERPQEVADTTPTQELPKEPQEPTPASLQEEFIATNFEIIRSMVLENLKYPRLAKRMQQSGIVELLLVIDKEGKLIDISLKNSSGYKLLDKSAIKAAQYLANMTLPAPKNTSSILLPVAFTLN